jgi:hypothetical protein
MPIFYCFERAYRQLLALNVKTSDPSEALNLIDLARKEASLILDKDYAQRIELHCEMLEVDVHIRYTPCQLALICVD